MPLDDEAKGPEYSDDVDPGDFSPVFDLSTDLPRIDINPDSSSVPATGRRGAISITDGGMLVRCIACLASLF